MGNAGWFGAFVMAYTRYFRIDTITRSFEHSTTIASPSMSIHSEAVPNPHRLQVPHPAQVAAAAAPVGVALPSPQALDDFVARWKQCFERFGQDPGGELSYRDLLLEFEEDLAPRLRSGLRHGADAAGPALETLCELLRAAPPSPPPKPIDPQRLLQQRRRAARREEGACPLPEFDRPLFILSAPRSGSTLLFETLAAFPEPWTVGEESHELIEGIPALHPAAHGYASNRLTAADATPATVAALHERFARRLLDRDGHAYLEAPDAPARVRLLEKTPKNALRIPFLRAAFPAARFLVLYRRPEETLGSMLDGWRSRRFNAYQPLPGWPHRAWKFLLAPGWETLAHRPLAEVVAHQWRMAYATLLADLAELPAESWLALRYADLVAAPRASLERCARFAGFEADARVERRLADGLPLSSMTFSSPDPDKWRRHATALEAVLPELTQVVEAMEGLCAPST